MRYKPIVYRRNPLPVPSSHNSPRVQDQQTGRWSYEQNMVIDDFGTLVDARFDGFDRNKGDDTLSSIDNQGGTVFLPNGGL